MRIPKDIRDTLALAAPIAASQVSDMVTLAVDLIMVGDLGTIPLAAVTLAGTSSTMVLLFGVGFTIAMTPEIATRMARGDASGASAAARTGAIMSVLVAAVLVGLLLLASPWLGILGAPADVTEMAIPYFRWYVLSFLFRLGFGAIKQTSEALGNSRMPMMIAIAANLLNVMFNWIFIYGELGMPEMGAEGAGFATFLSRVCAVGIGVWVLRRSSLFAPLRGHAQQTLSGKERMSLALAGASIGLQITLEVAAFAFGGLMVGWLGAVPLAAHQVALNLASITFMGALGLSSAGTVRVASALGSGVAGAVRRAAHVAIGIVVAFELITAVGFILLRHELPLLYSDDPLVLVLASQLLVYAAAFQLFDGLQVVGMGILRGLNDTRVPAIMAFVAYIMLCIPLGYVIAFPLGFGAHGIWIGYVIGLTIASIGYLWRFRAITNKGSA